MASSFSTLVAAKLGTFGEYVYLWNKLPYSVVWIASMNLFIRPSCCAMVRSDCFVSISTSKPIQ